MASAGNYIMWRSGNFGLSMEILLLLVSLLLLAGNHGVEPKEECLVGCHCEKTPTKFAMSCTGKLTNMEDILRHAADDITS